MNAVLPPRRIRRLRVDARCTASAHTWGTRDLRSPWSGGPPVAEIVLSCVPVAGVRVAFFVAHAKRSPADACRSDPFVLSKGHAAVAISISRADDFFWWFFNGQGGCPGFTTLDLDLMPCRVRLALSYACAYASPPLSRPADSVDGPSQGESTTGESHAAAARLAHDERRPCGQSAPQALTGCTCC